MARKPTPKPARPASPALPVAQLNAAQQIAAREMASSENQIHVTLRIGQRMGRRQIFAGLTKLLTVSDIQDLSKIKDSKEYKGFQVFQNVGGVQKCCPVSTWAEYCEHVEGRSHQLIDEEIRHLERLGPECFMALRDAGLGPRRLRDLREVSDADSTALLQAAKSGSKDAVLDAAEEIIASHKAAMAKLQDELDTARKDIKSIDSRLDQTRKQADEAEEEAATARRSWKASKPDKQLADLQRELQAEMVLISHQLMADSGKVSSLRKRIAALLQHGEQHGQEHHVYLAGIIAQLERNLYQLRDEFLLPRIAAGDPAIEADDATGLSTKR